MCQNIDKTQLNEVINNIITMLTPKWGKYIKKKTIIKPCQEFSLHQELR